MSVLNERKIIFVLACTLALFLVALFANVLRFTSQGDEINELRSQIKKIDEGKVRMIVKQDEQLLNQLAALSNENAMLKQKQTKKP